ncbi:MAG: CatB-related O-acetyltransferase [Mariniblastus sp.]|nr:CatB-related O-acetyltransferase [Mariniblastus sp.]
MNWLIKNRLTRLIRRGWRNVNLKRRYQGFMLGRQVEIVHCHFGRFNKVCDRSRLANSTLGDYSYVGTDTKISNATIGKFCSIGPNVTISMGMHPTKTFVSTHPVFYSLTFPSHNRFATEQGFVEHGSVTIESDVWIGHGASICDNVTIGTGAIVAAGAVVTANVEPYSIVGGVPAKFIRKRFDAEQIEQLLASQWWKQSDAFLAKHHREFHNIDTFMKTVVPQLNQDRPQ